MMLTHHECARNECAWVCVCVRHGSHMTCGYGQLRDIISMPDIIRT